MPRCSFWESWKSSRRWCLPGGAVQCRMPNGERGWRETVHFLSQFRGGSGPGVLKKGRQVGFRRAQGTPWQRCIDDSRSIVDGRLYYSMQLWTLSNRVPTTPGITLGTLTLRVRDCISVPSCRALPRYCASDSGRLARQVSSQPVAVCSGQSSLARNQVHKPASGHCPLKAVAF